MVDILMTIGHGSSVIAVEDGIILNGYEEERLTRVKGDSRFPINCMEMISRDFENKKIGAVYVSHWFDNFQFMDEYNERINKYWDYAYMTWFKKHYGCNIVSLEEGVVTHTDCHAYAGLQFFKNHCAWNEDYKDLYVIAADGFGNRQEVYSIYKVVNTYQSKHDEVTTYRTLDKIHSCTGYENSLGLMYQYATEFCDMKPMQDEYKFLGYESSINKYADMKKIEEYCEHIITLMFNNIVNSKQEKYGHRTYIDTGKLEQVKMTWFSLFDKLLGHVNYQGKLGKLDADKFIIRSIIGYAIQYIIENVNLNIINTFNIKKVILSGGIFYNVKLNNAIMNNVDKICIMPLAGDQGNAIGLYSSYVGINDIKLTDLCFGKRTFKNYYDLRMDQYYRMLNDKKYFENIKYFDVQYDLVEECIECLKHNDIPQLVLGDMEFGPRALCHTSTLCLPSQTNVSMVNEANDRNEVMPCAPVILERNLDYFFDKEQYSKVTGSDQFMILTYDYKIPFNTQYNIDGVIGDYSGIMHKYPNEEKYSGRPQVIKDKNSTIYKILDILDVRYSVKALVNTSYNVHGRPIVYSAKDAVDDYFYQIHHAKYPKDFYLFIGAYKESFL